MEQRNKAYQQKKLQARYKSTKAKHFRAQSFDSLMANGAQLLMAHIARFIEERVPRFDRLDDYFMSENTDIHARDDRVTSSAEELADHRVSHSFAEFITSFLTSFTIGKPLTYNYEDGKEADDIKEMVDTFNQRNDIDLHNFEVLTDASIYGEGLELMYRRGEGKEAQDRITLVPRMNSFLVYDMTLENNVIAGVYFITQNIDGKQTDHVTVYSSTAIYESEPLERGAKRAKFYPNKLHPYGEVPLVDYRNNRFGIGDYERVIPLIDAYDSCVSDTANYMTDLTDAVLAISGRINANMTDEQIAEVRHARTLFLSSGVDEDGNFMPTKAEYLYKQYDVQGVEAHKKRLENDIHKLSYTPNFNDEKFGGSLSGEALSYKLVGLDQARAAKQNYFTKGFAKRYRLLANAHGIPVERMDGLSFTFHENIPQAVLEELRTYTQSGGQLSRKTMISLLSFIDNADEELEQINREAEEEKERWTVEPYHGWGGDETEPETAGE